MKKVSVRLKNNLDTLYLVNSESVSARSEDLVEIQLSEDSTQESMLVQRKDLYFVGRV